MSIYEISLALIVTLVVALSIFSHKIQSHYIRVLALLGLFVMLAHFLIDSPRWPMLPFYLAGILCPFLVLLKVHRVLKIITNSLTLMVLLLAALVSILVQNDPTINSFKEPHTGKLSYNLMQVNQTDKERSQDHGDEHILLLSKPGDSDNNEYFSAIDKLIEKGYTVVTIAALCEKHDTLNDKLLIKKAQAIDFEMNKNLKAAKP
ncbi:MAG: hypothetical protein AAFN93_13450, partial [Bacteroidota bacterium]